MSNELYIVMDDSGNVTKNENSCIYGGLFFYSKEDYNRFITKYKSIINSFKCHYCHQSKNKCHTNNCIEIKGTSRISSSRKRQIYNLIKKENNYAVFINNSKIYNFIIKDKASRGRFIDYAQKRIIKQIIEYSIKNNYINTSKEINIYIKIDSSKTKSNGYYDLSSSIYEELVHGIINFDYSTHYKPIIKNNLNLNVKKYNSKYNYGIQSADMISNYLHREYEKNIINNKDIRYIYNQLEVKLFLP